MSERTDISRRRFLAGAAAASISAGWLARVQAAEAARLRIGSCAIGLPQAKQAGLDGVEINVGPAADTLRIADPNVRREYKQQMEQTGLTVASLMMGLLNGSPLAADPRGPAWLEQSIDAARDLGAKVILVAFFGKGDLLDKDGKVKPAEMDAVVARLRAAAPRARDAGVVLAVENLLPAAENIRMLDRIGHASVQFYYDVFNAGVTKGYDVPAELKLLKDRVVQVHFKNGPKYLEDRDEFFKKSAAALKDIGYKGWIVLETSSPSKDAVADARRNAEYARRILGA